MRVNMLNWEKIYLLNNKNNKHSGTTFEQLALEYLSNVYPNYSWENTKSSWDNNRDFISLILNNIWGEAKYKKDSSPLRRQDIDPTLISGFLNGEIKLLFLITNGTIPQTINTRINEIGKKCGFKVVCITNTQLEYWLITHPKQYEKFFKEKLPASLLINAVNIENVKLFNRLEANFESSYIKPEFINGEICELCITISCNTEVDLIIIEKINYPFSFLENPRIHLLPGLQQKCFLVKLDKENSDPVILEFKNEDNSILVYSLDIIIISSDLPKLVYPQQESVKINIYNSLSRLPTNDNINHIIELKGKYGYGKTYLMKELSKDLSFLFVVVMIQFETNKLLGANCIKLCQIIMYFNFGDIYQKNDSYTMETKNYYKYLLRQNNSENFISNELLIDIFEGCFDTLIAKKVILYLSAQNHTIIIKKSTFARRHILFIDDVQFLSPNEQEVFKMILSQLKDSKNNSTLIFSYDKFNYPSANVVSYKLEGLQSQDIYESLKHNLNQWQFIPFASTVEKMPRQPQMITELILFIKQNSITNLSSHNVNEYILKIYNNKITNFKMHLTNQEKNIVELLFNFPNGINTKLTNIANIDKNILNNLCDKGFIILYKQRYIPCYDYFRYSYINQNEKNMSNNSIIEYLSILIENSYEDSMFDTVKAQALLLQNDPNLYFNLKSKFKNKLLEYVDKNLFREAMLYGEVFCFDILNNSFDSTYADFEALFYYGIALIHCDSQRRAIEIFTYIKNNAKKNTPIYFRASSELLNNMYSRFLVKGLLQEAIVLKYDIYNYLSNVDDNNFVETHKLRIAYSTCMNRMMMIYFLLGDCSNAKDIYSEYKNYHLTIPTSEFSCKYESMLLEWQMDYARGVAVYDLKKAIEIDKNIYFKFSERTDFRRKILCEVDLILFQAIEKNNYDNAIDKLYLYKNKFNSKGIVSEDVKIAIRISCCQLMKYKNIFKFDNIFCLSSFVDDICAELFRTQLEDHLISQGRTSYLLNNTLAILHIIKNEKDVATKLLEYNYKSIKYCGEIYKKICKHNLYNINNITKVDWYFYEKELKGDTYYLDVRIW